MKTKDGISCHRAKHTGACFGSNVWIFFLQMRHLQPFVLLSKYVKSQEQLNLVAQLRAKLHRIHSEFQVWCIFLRKPHNTFNMFFLTQSDPSAYIVFSRYFLCFPTFDEFINSWLWVSPEIEKHFQVRIGEVKTYMEKGLLLMVRFAQLNWRWHIGLGIDQGINEFWCSKASEKRFYPQQISLNFDIQYQHEPVEGVDGEHIKDIPSSFRPSNFRCHMLNPTFHVI